jgi:hypothetical protein
MMYANGDIYEGMWAFDLKHGPGTFFHINKVRGWGCEGRCLEWMAMRAANHRPHDTPLQGKRFDGTWHEGTAKCGTYSEIHTPPPGTPGSLPPIELKQPDAVLQAARQEVLGA